VSIPKTLTNIKIDVLDSNYGTGKLVNQYIYYSFDRIRIERDLWQITTTYYTDMITSWINKNWKVELIKNSI
jgi:hypothetical protein